MFHKIKTFIALPGKRLIIESWFTQLWVGLLLKAVPFKKIPSMFPNPEASKNTPASNLPSPAPGEGPGLGADSGGGRAGAFDEELDELRNAILLTSHYSPWRNKCLVQSLAARKMLKKRGITSQLSLGLRKDQEKKMLAHAWIKVGEKEIVSKSGDYLELFVF
jgi:hypothetical protein